MVLLQIWKGLNMNTLSCWFISSSCSVSIDTTLFFQLSAIGIKNNDSVSDGDRDIILSSVQSNVCVIATGAAAP